MINYDLAREMINNNHTLDLRQIWFSTFPDIRHSRFTTLPIYGIADLRRSWLTILSILAALPIFNTFEYLNFPIYGRYS